MKIPFKKGDIVKLKCDNSSRPQRMVIENFDDYDMCVCVYRVADMLERVKLGAITLEHINDDKP